MLLFWQVCTSTVKTEKWEIRVPTEISLFIHIKSFLQYEQQRTVGLSVSSTL